MVRYGADSVMSGVAAAVMVAGESGLVVLEAFIRAQCDLQNGLEHSKTCPLQLALSLGDLDVRIQRYIPLWRDQCVGVPFICMTDCSVLLLWIGVYRLRVLC